MLTLSLVPNIRLQRNCWLSGSVDAEVRQYARGKTELEGLVTSAIGVPIRSIAVDPKGSRVAVASEYVIMQPLWRNTEVTSTTYSETAIKIIDLEDTTKMMLLKGHSKAVRRVSWHPSGALLVSSSTGLGDPTPHFVL